jgi:Type VI secretion system (T6SS), amidase effector protein 4
MKIPFNVLKLHYPRSHEIDRPALFREIGWDDVVNNPAFENTCAIRVSLALIKSGIKVPGRMRIKTGPYKDELIEMGQANLSHILARTSFLGKPEVFTTEASKTGIGSRTGIVSLWQLYPGLYAGGHIDIITPEWGGKEACGSGCHWKSREVWFWPMR